MGKMSTGIRKSSHKEHEGTKITKEEGRIYHEPARTSTNGGEEHR